MSFSSARVMGRSLMSLRLLGMTGCFWVCLSFGEFKFDVSGKQIPDVAKAPRNDGMLVGMSVV